MTKFLLIYFFYYAYSPLLFAMGPTNSNEEKCKTANEEIFKIESKIREYKVTCGYFPSNLNDLIKKSKSCKAWRKENIHFLNNILENKILIKKYFYQNNKETFILKPLDCPN